jgi:hypothetical protein
MNLDEWLELTSEQRNEIRSKWRYEWDKWSHLLFEAVDRFTSKYGNHPQIGLISAAYLARGKDCAASQDIVITEPKISVTTTLRLPEMIEELPSRFAHFTVEQKPFADTRDFYIEVWSSILKNLLHWSDIQIKDWMDKNHADNLAGKGIMFTHLPPCSYIASVFLPKSKIGLHNLLKFRKARQEIERILIAEFQFFRPIEEINWSALRTDIDKILREFGESLPNNH